MRRYCLTILAMILMVAVAAVALDEEAIERADALYDGDRPDEAIVLLESLLPAAATGAERAEILWRLSRATLSVGESMEDADAETSAVLATYERGEQYAIEAVAADPSNHLGYYWQSANVGKWGQARGILNALFRAGPMRDLLRQAIEKAPEHAGSYYVLGQLYAQVPGIISFGNNDYAVSLARKSIDLHEAEYAAGVADEVEHDYYIQLASHLIDRNWNARRRAREQQNKVRSYERTSDPLERGWYYEGTIAISDESDREEAERLLRDMIRRLEAITDRSDGQERQLERARELKAGL